MERRLAAILVADVVGYSRLMERDEADTFARLKTYRTEVFEPLIASHHGRVFKLMGDGLLAEFGSAADALDARSHCLRRWPGETPACRRTGGSSCVSACMSAM